MEVSAYTSNLALLYFFPLFSFYFFPADRYQGDMLEIGFVVANTRKKGRRNMTRKGYISVKAFDVDALESDRCHHFVG